LKIGFIGDIVGRPARFMIQKELKKIRKRFSLDFVIANYENASHGFGVTEKNTKELVNYGVDFMTGGNHSWDKKDIIPVFDSLPLIRPLNFPTSSAGVGYKIVQIKNKKVAIINLMGNFGMPMSDNPFTKIVESLKTIQADHIFIDFHAETTAEKRTLLMMLADKVDIIYGTHTHVATDDYQLFKNRCFYITDIGLTGCYDNVIGMDSESSITRVLTGVSSHNKVPEPKDCQKILQMVIADFETKKGFTYKVFENGESVIREAFYL